ncbi:MOSC domain-containing protein [Aquirhabdus sp.]|uniref:MOSC domain-containing protein n=1 Tax=Aquirhabdus sp. TaxID=2824160 RepID=UPI00396C53DA
MESLYLQEPVVEALYVGKLQTLMPEGQQTGIFKDPTPSAEINELGIVGDIQADKRVHGGIDKALHQYALSSYKAITDHYPELSGIAVAGSIGENISSQSLEDTNVHIGDIYEIGSVIVQVSQPRSPCWKINHRFDTHLLSQFIAEHCITGWYYRVLRSGQIHVGDPIKALERFDQSLSITEFNRIVTSHRPLPEVLAQAAQCPGLALDWKNRLDHRIEYLNKIL